MASNDSPTLDHPTGTPQEGDSSTEADEQLTAREAQDEILIEALASGMPYPDAGKLAAMLRTIAECPKPTIARVQGDVYAGGMGLVAACDMAVSVDSAHFCLSEVKLGLVPATISPYVIRAMGARAAHRYFLTAERFSAAQALRIGLVHEVVGADALDATVADLVGALLGAGPNAVRQCKRLVQDVAERDISRLLIERTVEGIADIRASDEGKEGVQSFLQKRKPNWLTGS